LLERLSVNSYGMRSAISTDGNETIRLLDRSKWRKLGNTMLKMAMFGTACALFSESTSVVVLIETWIFWSRVFFLQKLSARYRNCE